MNNRLRYHIIHLLHLIRLYIVSDAKKHNHVRKICLERHTLYKDLFKRYK